MRADAMRDYWGLMAGDDLKTRVGTMDKILRTKEFPANYT
jgi:hypothetical protein